MKKTLIYQTAHCGKTDIWNDSCSIEELNYAIEENAAVGATTNPVIVKNVLMKEMYLWEDMIREMIDRNPEATEDDIAWQLIEQMGLKGAELLYPIFQRENGKKGRLSIQVNAKYYRDSKAMVEQAVYFSGLAPNIQVKIPVTKAGIQAIEDATAAGVNINATVCFTVPQAIAVAEAVERGLARRHREGKETDEMTPVCTIMEGRLDDWFKQYAKKTGLLVDPGIIEWAGVAVAKRVHEIYREKGYQTRLLIGALRNYMQWSELVGGDLIMTLQASWQKKINANEQLVAENRIGRPVDPAVIKALEENFPDFARSYEPDGMTEDEFATFPSTLRTLRAFNEGYQELLGIIRNFMLPNPD